MTTFPARAAWSDNEADILLFEDLDTGSIRVHHHRLDEFDADEDRSVTIGEFRVEDLRRALIPPTPARSHTANQAPWAINRLFGKRRGGAA